MYNMQSFSASTLMLRNFRSVCGSCSCPHPRQFIKHSCSCVGNLKQFFFSECASNGYVYSFIEVYSSLTNAFHVVAPCNVINRRLYVSAHNTNFLCFSRNTLKTLLRPRVLSSLSFLHIHPSRFPFRGRRRSATLQLVSIRKRTERVLFKFCTSALLYFKPCYKVINCGKRFSINMLDIIQLTFVVAA